MFMLLIGCVDRNSKSMLTSRSSFSIRLILSFLALFVFAMGLSFSLWYFGLVAITLLILIVPLSIFLARQISRPLEALTKTTLHRSEASRKNLFETSPDAVVLIDLNVVIDCNPAALQLFGVHERKDLLSMHPGHLSPPTQKNGEESRAAADLRIDQAMREGHAAFEWQHQRLDNGQIFTAVANEYTPKYCSRSGTTAS